MHERIFEGMDLNNISHEDAVSCLNRAYNYDATRSYTYYNKSLNLLSHETLISILRTLSLAAKDKGTTTFIKQFVRRWQCNPENISSFAALSEAEYFHVRNALTGTYGITPDNISMGNAISSVLTLEEEIPRLALTRHQLVLLLAAAAGTECLGTARTLNLEYGPFLYIDEDAFRTYIQTKYTDDHFHQVLTAICSGQKYSRFLEVLENANGTTSKPLIYGML